MQDRLLAFNLRSAIGIAFPPDVVKENLSILPEGTFFCDHPGKIKTIHHNAAEVKEELHAGLQSKHMKHTRTGMLL